MRFITLSLLSSVAVLSISCGSNIIDKRVQDENSIDITEEKKKIRKTKQ